MAYTINIGDTVCLTPAAASDAKWKNDTAKVVKVEVFSDIPGSIQLEPPLRGFRFWNIADLRVVRRATKGV